MKEFKYVVTDAQGIHARPAGILVKAIAKKTSDIKIKKAGDTRECKEHYGSYESWRKKRK